MLRLSPVSRRIWVPARQPAQRSRVPRPRRRRGEGFAIVVRHLGRTGLECGLGGVGRPGGARPVRLEDRDRAGQRVLVVVARGQRPRARAVLVGTRSSGDRAPIRVRDHARGRGSGAGPVAGAPVRHNPLCQRIGPGHVEVSSAVRNRREWALRRNLPQSPLADPRGPPRRRARERRDLARQDPELVAADLERSRALLGEQLTLW